MTKTSEWQGILGELRGRRLAVYDDVMNGKAVELRDPAVQNIMGWLAYNRLVWRDGTDSLAARTFNEAREVWMRDGPDRQASHATRPSPEAIAEPEPTGEPAAAPVRPRVHDHQPDLFT